MKYFGKVLRSEKADVNIALTAETAMASIKAVKKAYHILLVNIDTVVPKDLLDRILHQILMTDGKHWSYDLPTFDELAKNQKNEASRGEKEMGIIRQRDREKEKEKESDRELKKIATEKSSKLGNKSEVTVIPHLLDGETIKDDRDVKLEKSASTLLFQCCPALSLAANINQKFQETNLNAKNIAINQYMVKSERVRTDSPNIKAEHSQNRAEYKPMMSCSLTMKEEKDMNHAKTKIRFDIGDTENNSRSTKNKDGLFDSHSDLKEGCGAGAGDRIGTGTGIGLGVNSSRDQYKHEDTIPIGGMGVLSTRKLQKISS